jgi:hypothetical protein
VGFVQKVILFISLQKEKVQTKESSLQINRRVLTEFFPPSLPFAPFFSPGHFQFASM